MLKLKSKMTCLVVATTMLVSSTSFSSVKDVGKRSQKDYQSSVAYKAQTVDYSLSAYNLNSPGVSLEIQKDLTFKVGKEVNFGVLVESRTVDLLLTTILTRMSNQDKFIHNLKEKNTLYTKSVRINPQRLQSYRNI